VKKISIGGGDEGVKHPKTLLTTPLVTLIIIYTAIMVQVITTRDWNPNENNTVSLETYRNIKIRTFI